MGSQIQITGPAIGGLAAALRLAKLGHHVSWLPGNTQLWSSDPIGDWLVDPWPLVLTFPAPWRDLFKKTGRDLASEAKRVGLELAPAPPAQHYFSDGSYLALPGERGAQFNSIKHYLGENAATEWRDFLDAQDDIWMQLRALGIETELATADQLTKAVCQRLGGSATVADVAGRLNDERLAELVRATAWRSGSRPEDTPSWLASRLVLERTFGRWQLQRLGQTEPLSSLVQLLRHRLIVRRVKLEPLPNPQALIDASNKLPAELSGALAPKVSHLTNRDTWPIEPEFPQADEVIEQPGTAEIVHHSGDGPIVYYYRVSATCDPLLSVHDYPAATPDPRFGASWQWSLGGFWQRLSKHLGTARLQAQWLTRQPIRLPAQQQLRYQLGPATRAGNEPWAQLATAALVTYAAHEDLTGQDIRPQL